MDYNIVSGGTENHLMLIDLRNKNVTGKQAENSLDASGITCNKNAVPYDTQPPLVTSGIRLGAAAMTSRGMKEDDMRQIARFIDQVITNFGNEETYKSVKHDVQTFCRQFPLYPSLVSA
jgi:glycine hydroxymethyltransferase